ncbi:uncharacterized protein K02A2.6-like [Uranotaenia lowii]|uniref:uncharacterized protein K02A2.6-like n=1 Tax=Uranotaenia lowii TaxID=190385 RepID=UPI002478E0ED|nr:uncharacterized protein K02A2.6-like [Uranotaenia lowii]
MVDAYSMCPEVFRIRSTTTTATLEILQETFARYPRTLVTDNSSQFVSSTFKQFCESNGVCHIITAPHHPQSNGQADRFVDALKRDLNKLVKGESRETFQHLQIMLSTYRSTPNQNAPEGKTPAELFLKRPVRTTLDLAKPQIPSPTEMSTKQRHDDSFIQPPATINSQSPDCSVQNRRLLSWLMHYDLS